MNKEQHQTYRNKGDMSGEGWVWVKIVDPATDHSVILPQPLVVQPRECEDLIPEPYYMLATLMTHWICDHEDAGTGLVHLAICPTLKCSKTGGGRHGCIAQLHSALRGPFRRCFRLYGG